eukprot:scaffold116_cov334-Pavlova_lutheri.AAC.72
MAVGLDGRASFPTFGGTADLPCIVAAAPGIGNGSRSQSLVHSSPEAAALPVLGGKDLDSARRNVPRNGEGAVANWLDPCFCVDHHHHHHWVGFTTLDRRTGVWFPPSFPRPIRKDHRRDGKGTRPRPRWVGKDALGEGTRAGTLGDAARDRKKETGRKAKRARTIPTKMTTDPIQSGRILPLEQGKEAAGSQPGGTTSIPPHVPSKGTEERECHQQNEKKIGNAPTAVSCEPEPSICNAERYAVTTLIKRNKVARLRPKRKMASLGTRAWE